MERREVQRHVGAEVLDDPVVLGVELGVESFSPGISRFVISNQTSVSCLS